jgi:hypothetical protein
LPGVRRGVRDEKLGPPRVDLANTEGLKAHAEDVDAENEDRAKMAD